MNEDKNPLAPVTSKIDWSIVVSLIVAALLLAAIVFGLKKSGIKFAKDIAANV